MMMSGRSSTAFWSASRPSLAPSTLKPSSRSTSAYTSRVSS